MRFASEALWLAVLRQHRIRIIILHKLIRFCTGLEELVHWQFALLFSDEGHFQLCIDLTLLDQEGSIGWHARTPPGTWFAYPSGIVPVQAKEENLVSLANAFGKD